jgi:hypothetical protein
VEIRAQKPGEARLSGRYCLWRGNQSPEFYEIVFGNTFDLGDKKAGDEAPALSRVTRDVI